MSEFAALSLRIQETGGQAVVDRLHAIDEAGGDASESLDEVTVSMKGVTASAKGIGSAAGEVAKWSGTQKELSKEIAEGTRLFQLQARTVDVTSKTAVQELRSSAAAQREWLKQIGASTQEQLKFGAAVQQFERKVAAAEVAQRRMAAQTTKQGQATQALNGQLVNANGQVTAFGKSGLRAINGLAFAFAQMADQGEASLRSLAGQMTSVLSLLGKGGAIAAIGSTVGLAVFDVMRAAQKRAIDRTALERQTAIKNALTQQKAFLDLTETQARAGFDEGVRSLRSYYDERGRIIEERTKAEIASREQQAAALEDEAAARLRLVQIAGKDLPDALRAESLKQADELRAQAQVQRAEAKAAADQGQAEAIRNTSERAAAERQLADQVRQFEAQRLEAQGKTHNARIAAITAEAAAFDRALAAEGVAAAEREARVGAFTLAMTQQANLAQAQADFARLQTDLDTRRLEVQQALAAGKISEFEAAEQIAAIERSALPTLNEMVDRALKFAAALGDEGAVAALRALKVELQGLGQNNWLDGLITQVEQLPATLGNLLGDALGAAFSGGMDNAKQVLLSGLGGILVAMGRAMIAAAPILGKIRAALITLNPVAALAAGVALVAIGSAIGGAARGERGGGGGGGSAAVATSSAPPATAETRIAVGDNRASAAAARTVGATAAAAPPTVNVWLGVWDKNDSGLQRKIAETVRAATSRGLL
jgi:hypothetical protein